MPEQHRPSEEGMRAILDIEDAVDRLTVSDGHMTAMGVLMSLIYRKLTHAHAYAVKNSDQAGMAETWLRYKDILDA